MPYSTVATDLPIRLPPVAARTQGVAVRPQVTHLYTRPWLYPKQVDAIFSPKRYAVIEASTKSGKTVGALVWIGERAMLDGRPGQHFWWVAPVFGQAKIAYRRLRRWLPPRVFTENRGELTITLDNHATIWFRSAENPDALYGEDVHAAVMDEATRCREEAWHALRSTLTATKGPVRIIGNVKGRKNWAYRLARKAEAGEPEMHYARITAGDAVAAGILDADEVEDARRQLPDTIFRQLFEAEAADDEGNPFGIDAIGQCLRRDLAPGPAVVWGWDLAKSMDWTVGIALNAQNEVCAAARFQKSWTDTIDTILTLTGSTSAVVDSTGVGDPIVEQLQKRGSRNFEGFKFTHGSKQQLMEKLAVAIQQEQIHYPSGIGQWANVIRDELESFEYVFSKMGVSYSAPPGMHDDCVCALALAVWKPRLSGGRRRVFGV